MVKSQSRIYAKINDDNMIENNNNNYTLIYENLDFMKNELVNLTCFDILNDLPFIPNAEGLVINLRNRSSKIVPLKKK